MCSSRRRVPSTCRSLDSRTSFRPRTPADAAYSDNYLLEAVARAKASGAAAWTLHSEGGFAFHTSDQPPAPPNLTLVEADFLERLDQTLASVPWNVGCP